MKVLVVYATKNGASKEAVEILLRIDNTPIDGLNIIIRLVNLIADIGQNEEISGFFGYAEQDQKAKGSSGSPTENIKAQEK